MNIFVHLLIANSVRTSVYKKTGAKLSFAGFLFGNILPDISPKYDENPHYYKDSLSFVIESAAKLNNSAVEGGINSFSYSQKVGVITHYLSDFFCYAHSEHYNENIYQHHVYEFLMFFLFRRGLLLYHQTSNPELINFSELENFINSNSKDYSSKLNLKVNDVFFALNVSVAFILCLLKENVFNHEKNFFAYNNINSEKFVCREAE